jgi:hypothetical protein
MCKSKFFFILILLIAYIQFSCKETVTNVSSDGLGGETTPHRIVTNNPTSIISYADLANLQKGTTMKLRVNRNEFEVWEVYVKFDAIYREGSERLILCHSNSDFPIGAGDSGSPLLTSDDRVAGVLCYGYYGNSNDFIARAIEDVLGIDTAIVSKSPTPKLFNEIQPVYIVSGYNEIGGLRYPQLGTVLGKYTIQTEQPSLKKFSLLKTNENLAVPGSSISVMYISGDYVYASAIGTMSFRENGNIFAFGHSYDSFSAAPTFLACTKSFIQSNYRSFKMSEPTNQFIGSFVKNNYNGILIKENVQPLVANLTTSCAIDNQNAFLLHHQISNTTNFRYDRNLAADLSCYLIYQELIAQYKVQDTAIANCSLQIVSEQESKTTTFTVHEDNVDLYIYYYILDSIQTAANSKELKGFNLSVDLKFGK